METTFFKRASAYLIDFMIILLISTIVGMFIPISDKALKANEEAGKLYGEILNADKATVDVNELMTRYQDLQYTVSKETIPISIISTIVYILYYMGYQFYNKGQTLGKKLMHIRIVKEEGTLSFNDIIIRTLLINGILFQLIKMFLVIILNKNMYLAGSVYLEFVQLLFVITTVIMILYRKDKRGLHDLITKTKVVGE